MIGFLGWLVGIGKDDGAQDGFGQSLLDDLRFLVRFQRCRRMAVDWRRPSLAERQADDAHPILGRFGDDMIAVAQVEGRRWIVREQDWYGWPDPPRYVLFILDDARIWVAADFDVWPTAWQRPPADRLGGADHIDPDGRWPLR